MDESRTAVVVAALANAGIAVTKFIAAALSGSSAMLSEGIHSVVDTADQLLMLLGQHRARRPADEEHPFGYGHELYFWTLVVSIMIFGLGGGVSFYEGLLRLLEGGGEVRDPTWTYVVLGASALLEGTSWMVALKKLNARRQGRTFWRTFRESKDPTVLTVVVEDSAALLGLLLAFLGIFLSRLLGVAALDAVASMCIGVVLAGVALLLARESRSLLVGESAGREAVERIRRAIARDAAVQAVGGVWTMQLAPQEILVNCEIVLARHRPAERVEEAVERIEAAVRSEEPRATRIFVELRSSSPGRARSPGAAAAPSAAPSPRRSSGSPS
jgi:cation diffusion facilitator family transporter